MAKFLVLWRVNPSAPIPLDPSKSLELNEMMWAMMDAQMKEGEVKEFGAFPDGISGDLIGEGENTDMLRGSLAFFPFILSEVHDIIPYEKHRETLRAVLKAQIAAAKK